MRNKPDADDVPEHTITNEELTTRFVVGCFWGSKEGDLLNCRLKIEACLSFFQLFPFIYC